MPRQRVIQLSWMHIILVVAVVGIIFSQLNIITGFATLPGAPVLTATPIYKGIKLTWTQPGDPNLVGEYQLKKTFPDGSTVNFYFPASQRSYTDDDVQLSKTYKYRLYAMDTEKKSGNAVLQDTSATPSASPSLTITSAAEYPDTSNLKVYARLVWTHGESAVARSSVKVERYNDAAGKYDLLATLGKDATTYDDKSITTCGQTWTYRITATYTDSATVLATRDIKINFFAGAPTSIGVAADDKQVRVSWAKPASDGCSAITGYYVYRADDAGFITDIVGASVSSATTAYTFSGLTNGKTYYFKVQATNTLAGSKTAGAFSSTVNAKPLGKPGAPTLNSVTATGDKQLTLKWTANSDTGGSPITDWSFCASLTSGGTCQVGGWLSVYNTPASAREFNLTSAMGLAKDTAYYVRIAAKNAVGLGTYSNELSATAYATPSAPLNTKATAGVKKNTLTWSAPTETGSGGISAYSIWLKKEGDAGYKSTWITQSTSFEHSGATVGTKYSYKISASSVRMSTVNGPLSAEVFGTPFDLPAAPAPLATASDSQVTLSWNKPYDGGSAITNYKIYRSTDSGKEALYKTVGSKSLSLDDSALTNGQTYYYKISAVNDNGNSEGPLSSEVSATPATTPGAPTLNDPTAGDGKITLSWIAPASDGGSALINYEVHRKTASTALAKIATVAALPVPDDEVFSYSDTGLTNGVAYSYRILATNAIGAGAFSSEKSATPFAAPTAPPAPTLNAANPGDKQVTLEWSSNGDGGSDLVQWNIYRGETSGSYSLIKSIVDVSQTTYDDTGLTNGKKYYYAVSAYNDAIGEGSKSNELSATPSPTPTAPLSPQSLQATASGKTITLSWNVPTSDGGKSITLYKIYRGVAFDSTSYIANVSSTVTSYSDAVPDYNKTYYYQVSAVNEIGESSKSAVANATTGAAPLPPSGKCNDNTSYAQCSTTKPNYCDNGNLVSKASACGCPAGQTASAENCVGPQVQQPSGETGGVGQEGAATGGEELTQKKEETKKPPKIQQILEDVNNRTAIIGAEPTTTSIALGIVIIVIIAAILFYLKKQGKLDKIIATLRGKFDEMFALLQEKFNEIFHKGKQGEKQPAPVQVRRS